MSLLKKNRPFFIFLIKFGLSYLLLSVLYWLYLGQFDAAKLEPDGITTIVAKQAVATGRLMGADASIVPHPREASYRYLMGKKSVMRIVEGCNAVSVMILFVAFVVAFTSTLKRTLLFIISGIIIIHILNIIRIALLGFGFYHYPEYKELLHDIIFPLFIYGVVFILWILWVTKFSIHEKHITAK